MHATRLDQGLIRLGFALAAQDPARGTICGWLMNTFLEDMLKAHWSFLLEKLLDLQCTTCLQRWTLRALQECCKQAAICRNFSRQQAQLQSSWQTSQGKSPYITGAEALLCGWHQVQRGAATYIGHPFLKSGLCGSMLLQHRTWLVPSRTRLKTTRMMATCMALMFSVPYKVGHLKRISCNRLAKN